MKFDDKSLQFLSTKERLLRGIDFDLNEELDTLRRHIKWFYQNKQMVEAMPELPPFPPSTFVHAGAGDIYITLPRIQSLINTIKDLPWNLEIFSLIEQDNSKFDGAYILRYSYLPSGIDNITFRFDATRAGSTCELVQIGAEEKISTVPIYEVVCTEGAEEMALGE